MAKKAAKTSAKKAGAAKKTGVTKAGAKKTTSATKAKAAKKGTAKKRASTRAAKSTTPTRATGAQVTLHIVGLALFVARNRKPMRVMLPNADLHAGHIEEHELWVAYRASQANAADIPSTDRVWPDNARLRARRITARAAIDFTGLVEPGIVKRPAGLFDIADLTGGKRVASSVLDSATVAHQGVRGRMTLPAGTGKVDGRGGKWRAKGVGTPFTLHPGADWTMKLKAAHLTLQVRGLEKPGILTTLPQLLPKGGPIELWVFHIPKHEADGHGHSREPNDGDPAGHFPAFYVIPALDAGAKPTPTYYKPAKRGSAKKAGAAARARPHGINPFTCMIGGDGP